MSSSANHASKKRKLVHQVKPDKEQKSRLNDLLKELDTQLRLDKAEFDSLLNPSDQLRQFGVFAQSVPVSEQELLTLFGHAGDAVAHTFPAVPQPIIGDLRQGNTNPFKAHWNSKSVGDSTMALRSWGAPFTFPLQKPAIESHTLNERVFWSNWLSAESSHMPYLDVLAMKDIYESLSEPRSRLFVSGDSVKICASRGPPTPPHSDEPRKGALARTQIAFMIQKEGARTLKALPASQRSCDLIRQIESLHSGFSTVKCPELLQLILKYSVGTTAPTAVLGWKAGIIHFETEGEGEATRFYCGVQDIADQDLTQALVTELITLAFLRKHGIDMASFNRKINGESLLFVNGKSTQSYKHTQGVDPRVVEMLKTPLAEMKEFLRGLTPFELQLHGLKLTDL